MLFVYVSHRLANAILAARHSWKIENGQKGGVWVELVAGAMPTATAHSATAAALFVPGCKHAFICCKVVYFNMGGGGGLVYGTDSLLEPASSSQSRVPLGAMMQRQ